MRHFFRAVDAGVQSMSATVSDVASGVQMQRTLLMIDDRRFAKPLVVDILRVVADKEHQYDLPFYYFGQIVNTNVKYTAHGAKRTALGVANGYQHLWVEADGPANGPAQVTLLNGRRYYSLTTAADSSTHVYFTRLGANDPSFNLRSEPGLLFRRRAQETVFATTLEPHGEFDPIKEFSIGLHPTIIGVRVLASDDEGTVVELTGRDGSRWHVMVTNRPSDPSAEHVMKVEGTTYRWKGDVEVERSGE
jgi:hypothetical protein